MKTKHPILKLRNNILYSLLFFVVYCSKIPAQSITIGSFDYVEQKIRNEQLMGKYDSLISFTLRPLTQKTKADAKKVLSFSTLPIGFLQQYNTLSSNSRNDGAVIPAKGFQTHFSAGFFAKYRVLDIQFNPEYVYAENTSFETFPLTEKNSVRLGYINYLNHTDIPTRFGNNPYHYLGWGQSSIKLNIKSIAVGISTENLWWGPGQKNSLIMSNNAPGFLHFTLNTRKPIQTKIGSFEAQIISGKLDNSGFDNPNADFLVDGTNYKSTKRTDWRYLSGLSINYHPKWVPGLFLGLNRVFQIYNTDLGRSFSDYFPFVTPFQKTNLDNEDAKKRDQLASVFLRWVQKESKSEIYFESGWNDHSSNILDLFSSPSHSRAILFGFGKIFTSKSNRNNYFKFNFEHTQMQQSADRLVRPAGAWYEHGIVLHGYTHRGQVLGAAIGPGGNSQILDFSFWKKNNVWGIQCERYSHNLDFYYDVITDYKQKWVDLNLNAYFYKRYGKVGIRGELNSAWMSNYQWQLNNNKLNVQLQVGLQYHL